MNIQDQTLAMFLSEHFGQPFSPESNLLNQIDQALDPRSSGQNFTIQVGVLDFEKDLIPLVVSYFEQTEPDVVPGEEGFIDDHHFCIFENRKDGRIQGTLICLEYYPHTKYIRVL